MKKVALFLCLFVTCISTSFALSIPEAEHNGHFGFGVNLGVYNDLFEFSPISSEAGDFITVTYFYKFSNAYTTELRLGYLVDQNIVNRSISGGKVVETTTFLTIDHLFSLPKIASADTYFRFGTGLYSVCSWDLRNNAFYYNCGSTSADISAGLGANVKVLGGLMNLDLTFPMLLKKWAMSYPLPYLISVGYRQEL
ncbi:MAG: hypothetical protein WC890_02165 [Candidatus Margulisiibacteriota bacterium]